MYKNAIDRLINVCDVEATCWDGNPPRGQVSDIIEVGIAVIDIQKLEIISTESILIKPSRSEVSDFCISLTTITQAMLDKDGVAFEQACKALYDRYNSANRIWASWGDYDRSIFDRNCRELEVRYPFGKKHINLKTLYAVLTGANKEVGMSAALKNEGLTLEGTHHRGGDDAKNIANVFLKMLARSRGKAA